MNVKAIEHGSGWLYGNNLGNPVHHHVVHGKGEASCFRSSPFLSKLSLTQGEIFNGRGSLIKLFENLCSLHSCYPGIFFATCKMIKSFKKTLFAQNLALCLYLRLPGKNL